jgi:ribosomal protein S18 acetylase RimI-like enzyme
MLSALGAITFRTAFAADNDPRDMAAYLAAAFSPAQQAAELADPRAVFFVAEIEGQAVGYAKLLAGDTPACVSGPQPIELERIYSLREWIGHGVGEALMRACLEEVTQAGYQTLWLGVWECNARAQAFYRKHGFYEVGKKIFQLGSDAQTDVVMERALLATNQARSGCS